MLLLSAAATAAALALAYARTPDDDLTRVGGSWVPTGVAACAALAALLAGLQGW